MPVAAPRTRLPQLDRIPEVALVNGEHSADVMRAEVAVAAADHRSEALPVAGDELVQQRAPAPADGNGENDLDTVHGRLVEQSLEHPGLDRTEVDRHEGVRHDRKPAR